MSVGATLPVESIESLAGTIKSQAASLQSTLASLRTQCQRDPSFVGTAAQRYDEYMAQWDTNQRGLVTALEGAGDLLARFAASLRDADTAYGNAFNI